MEFPNYYTNLRGEYTRSAEFDTTADALYEIMREEAYAIYETHEAVCDDVEKRNNRGGDYDFVWMSYWGKHEFLVVPQKNQVLYYRLLVVLDGLWRRESERSSFKYKRDKVLRWLGSLVLLAVFVYAIHQGNLGPTLRMWEGCR